LQCSIDAAAFCLLSHYRMSKLQRPAIVDGGDESAVVPPSPPLPPSLLPLSLLQTTAPPTPHTWSSFLLQPHFKLHTAQTFPSALLLDEHGTFSVVLRHFRLMTCGCAELERTSTMAPPPPLYGLDTARAAVEQLVHEVV
jgi:hypothetical protein